MALVLGNIPQNLSDKLLEEYLEIKKRYAVRDWGPGQLQGGRFAEVVLRILQHLLGITITPFGTDIPSTEKTKILNSVQNHPVIDEHVRQKVVSLTRLLLDFRNNRDSAHLGGFDVNDMDTLFVNTASTWVLCELIRVYEGHSMADAQKLVSGLSVKDFPVFIEFEGDIFITRPDLTARQEVLILLNKDARVDFDFLFSKTRDSNSSRFRGTLETLISKKLIGLKDNYYFLMPEGIKAIEVERLLEYK